MKEEALVFLISQPRSGSTYLQRLLSNTDAVNTSSEHWALLNFTQLLKPDLITGRFDAKMAQHAFIDYLAKYPDFKFDLHFKKFLLELYTPLSNGHEFVIDKTPRYWEILTEIQAIFPKSKCIILKRNPVDVLRSIIKTWEIKSLEELNYYKRDILVAPLEIDSFCKKNKTNPMVSIVHYEHILEATKEELLKLTSFIGYSFKAEMLEVEHNSKTQGTLGDPFQSDTYKEVFNKEKALSFKISEELENFINGYELFISKALKNDGKDFLKEITEEFPAFKRFMTLPDYRQGMSANDFRIEHLKHENRLLQKKLTHINASRSYRLYKKLLQPFQKIKQTFKST